MSKAESIESSDLMDSTRWGWRCMRQRQETDSWKRPAATTWAAEFLLREGESSEFLGSWSNASAVHEAKKRRAKQVISCSFPRGKWLHMIGARGANFAKERERWTWKPKTSRRKQWLTFKVPAAKRDGAQSEKTNVSHTLRWSWRATPICSGSSGGFL